MASIYIFLPDLPSNSRFHVVRVKVVSKTHPTQNPGRMRFQRVVLRDEPGNLIHLVLFGDDVNVYDQIFIPECYYDISNVSIKEERAGHPYARGRVMYITSSSVVRPVDLVPDAELYQGQFRTISEAMAIESMDEIFDVACIVATVTHTEMRRTHSGAMVEMAKFHVTDDSHNGIVDVAMWGPAASEVEVFSSRRNVEGVVTFEGLRKSSYGGKIGFTTAFGCVVCVCPSGPRVSALKNWATLHEKDIADRLEDSGQDAVVEPPEEVENIAVCLGKKPEEVSIGKTWQFVGYVQDFSDADVRVAVGCNRCGRSSNLEIGSRFMCPSCNRPTTCVAKLYFDFMVRDTTGSLCLSAPTRLTERILGLDANTFYKETMEERSVTLHDVRTAVCAKANTFIVSPAEHLLVNNNIIRWVLNVVRKRHVDHFALDSKATLQDGSISDIPFAVDGTLSTSSPLQINHPNIVNEAALSFDLPSTSSSNSLLLSHKRKQDHLNTVEGVVSSDISSTIRRPLKMSSLDKQNRYFHKESQDKSSSGVLNVDSISTITFSRQCASTQDVPSAVVLDGSSLPSTYSQATTSQSSRKRKQPSSETDRTVLPRKRGRPPKTDMPIQILKALGRQYVRHSPIPMKQPRLCEHCGAILIPFEPPGFCCSSGDVVLAPIFESPILSELFTKEGVDGEHFRTYCRMYNNFFAFSSLGGNLDSFTSDGVHTLTMQGQIYHFLPSIFPSGDKRNYLQLYFYDGMLEAFTRCMRISEFTTLNTGIMYALMCVTQNNPYARFFRAIHHENVGADYRIKIVKNPILDPTRYNAPGTDEVAGILVGDDDINSYNSPHIIVHTHADTTHRVMHYYGCYDPLQYPLLFTRGESGWFQGIPRRNRVHARSIQAGMFPISTTTTQTASDLISAEVRGSAYRPPANAREVSCREFYAYRFQICAVRSIINTSRIFLQYVVDMYIKVENTRLDFIRKNQRLLRSELYQGIVDSVNNGIYSASSIGKRIILPASFIGGPRDVKQRYLNAMALVQRFGRPDLFITMTCNPKWPEITALLRPGETSQDRPDVVARVFHAKLAMLKDELFKAKIFGAVAARIDVIEFQKRGLPHVHILIILEKHAKISGAAMYDHYVSAELPSVEDPVLRALVIKHMMHGPCGTMNPRCACMKTKNSVSKCRFDYPKAFAEMTTSGADSYPVYRRRDNGSRVRIRRHILNNRWVVPYNPYLLSAFDCHINVEICSTIKAVKYLYKYVYKGHDRICFNVERSETEMMDEPRMFQTGRWISSPEALWRVFKFKLFDISPSVLPLQVHLPDMHPTCFPANADLVQIAFSGTYSRTMLTAYFEANQRYHDARKYFYVDFPEYFVWNKSKKIWTQRVKQGSIGRLVYVAPTEGERYYLRLLLCHVRGATSFRELCTVHGKVEHSFKAACESYGLLHADDYADQCMDEATLAAMPRVLRRLFATLIHFVDGVNPRQLWNKYYPSLSEDYKYLHPTDDSKVHSLTYIAIEQFLESVGKDIKSYGLPLPEVREYSCLRATLDTRDAIHGVIPPEFCNSVHKLNQCQRAAYDAIMESVIQGNHKSFFIDGPGGTGKTFLYCVLVAEVRALGKIVLPTATSGIAASNLPMGRTAHSRFKIPLYGGTEKVCSVSKQSSLAALLKEASLIIWDEASMAKNVDIESIDTLLQDLCNSTRLFGGKTVVFGGDFRQVLPVVPKGTMDDAVCASLVTSYVWPQLLKFGLTENIRTRGDDRFTDFLLNLGNGLLQTRSHAVIHVPDDLGECCSLATDDLHHLISSVYPEIENAADCTINFCDRAILSPTNEGVDYINDEVIRQFPGDAVVYTGSDSLIDEKTHACMPEFLNLNALTPSGMSPYNLVLKYNCPVILLRNLDPAHGLCNGTRLICKAFERNIITCEISMGYYAGEQVFIPRILLHPPTQDNSPFEFQRRQFPIKLCFAMTINKSQGQTLDRAALYLHDSCFSHGQLYVACSRVRRADKLSIFSTSASSLTSCSRDIVNVVAYDVLKRANII